LALAVGVPLVAFGAMLVIVLGVCMFGGRH
jgi:hypothetical protein